MQSSKVSWYTQPQGKNASFYYYDKSSRDLVRIRMELNRDDKGNAKVIYTGDRYVGFGADAPLMSAKYTEFKVNTANNQITFNGKDMPRDPVPGLTVCDFSGTVLKSDDDVHVGNALPTSGAKPILPAGLTEDVLMAVAQKAIAKKAGKDLAAFNAKDTDVTAALKDAAQHW